MVDNMRLYLYIDKELLRILFSIVDDSSFNIEVMEYSVRKSNSTTNGINVSPCFEDFSECENESFDDTKQKTKCKESNFSKDKVGAGYDYSNTYNIQTEKRYINIEDITNMKNTNFYHKLIEKVRNKILENNKSRLCEEIGFASIYDFYRGENKDNKFILINDSLVWLNANNLYGDIELITRMNCKMHIIGYRVDCIEGKGKKIIKAIAIYIE